MRVGRIAGCFLPAMILAASTTAGDSAEHKNETDEPSRAPVVRTVGLIFGRADDALQTAAGGGYWSPVVLDGRGTHVRLHYQWERPHRLRGIVLTLSSLDSFAYETGVGKYDLPEGNNHWNIGLEYELAFFILRNVLFQNLDIGIGPRFRLEYLNTRRIHDPDVKIRFHEGYADMSFAVSARFRPARIILLRAEFGGGFLAGLTGQFHGISGRLPAQFSGGWQKKMRFEVGIGLGRRLWLAPVCEIEARSLEWTWGISYRRWTRRASLSLSCDFGARG